MQPRGYLIEEYTRTVCPHCAAAGQLDSRSPDVFVDGMLVSHDGSVWMRRFCPVHGETESLYEEDLGLWRARHGWSTPTLAITPDRPESTGGFPDAYREGLPASHGQHTCILLLNVTEHCNFSCPTCFATALEPGTPAEAVERPTLDELLITVDTMIERESGRLGVVMLSGGEPTVRRDIKPILTALAERPITRIMLNTNGRRIARDDAFVELLARLGERVEVYLQFDGLEEATHRHLRGEELADEKERVLARLNAAHIAHSMVMTVKRGVNEHELGALLKLGLEMEYCSGLMVQPVFGSGRNSGIDPMDRATPTGVIRRFAEQSGGLVTGDDFIPLPCSHRDCCDISYLVRTPKDGWRSIPSLLGRDELKRWIHLVSNSISFETASDTIKAMVRDGVLQRLFSEQQAPSSLRVAADMFKLCGCIPGLQETLGWIGNRGGAKGDLQRLMRDTFRVTVKMFMDADTFHEARIRQCCVHVGTFEEDPRRYSFCWRWLFGDAHDFPEVRRDLEALPMVR